MKQKNKKLSQNKGAETVKEVVKKEGNIILRIPLLAKKKKKKVFPIKEEGVDFVLEEYSGSLRLLFLKKMTILLSVLIFFVLAVFSFQLFIDFRKSNLISEQERISKSNDELRALIEEKQHILEEGKALDLELKKVQYLLDNHIYWSNLFNFLERKTLKSVYYTNFESGGKNQIILQAVTTSFDEMTKQIKAFQDVPELEEVDVSSGSKSIVKGVEKVRFNIILKFKKDFFFKFFKDKYFFE